MCGRYVRRSDKQKIAEYFHANPQPAELLLLGEDYNVAPTTFQPIIRQSRESANAKIVLARWGLVPFFTKQLSDIKGLSTINARSESITKAPTWREPMKKRRFLEGDSKTVIGRRFDVPTDEELFALAERGGADLEEVRQSIARWNKGSAWLNLTEQQYRRLLRPKDKGKQS